MVPQMKDPLRLKIVLEIRNLQTVTKNFDAELGLLIEDQILSNEVRVTSDPSLEYSVNQIQCRTVFEFGKTALSYFLLDC